MKFTKVIFFVAGVYGLLALAPQYFLEEKNGRDFPPAITHPEYYYGFVGVAIAWQIVFLIMSRDPARYRPIMLAAVVEKASYAIAVIILYLQGRTGALILGTGIIDLTFGALFLLAYARTRVESRK
ncbi:MAG TPA: hypothetical protein VJ810_35775 [Blastocatellia bacterium]|nr:hypothetical protein [Blastocatellia bacterium]